LKRLKRKAEFEENEDEIRIEQKISELLTSLDKIKYLADEMSEAILDASSYDEVKNFYKEFHKKMPSYANSVDLYLEDFYKLFNKINS